MTRSSQRRRARRRALLAAALVLPLAAGCSTDDLLQVTDPATLSPGQLSDSTAWNGLVAGAIRDFQVAYSGSGDDAFLSNEANFTDEMHDSETFPTRIAIDTRKAQIPLRGNATDAAFSRLQKARTSAKLAAEAISAANANDPRAALMRTYEAYTYVAIGEAFCGYAPFSDVVSVATGERKEGQPLTTPQMFDAAIERFDEALKAVPDDPFASIGKGRALLDEGKYAEAAAAVANVPTDFVKVIDHSDNTGDQENPIYDLVSNGRYSVSNNEGENGLDFRSEHDPRVPWADEGKGFDGITEVYSDLRYQNRSADVVLASGIEARLIEAEAALHAGDVNTWLSKLNELRANVIPLMTARISDYGDLIKDGVVADQPLPPLTDPGTEAARVDLMFHERAFWMFTTGHRLGDLRRLIRQYGRSQDQVFPTGTYHKSGAEYGDDVSWYVPFDETGNSLFGGPSAQYPDQCDVTKA